MSEHEWTIQLAQFGIGIFLPVLGTFMSMFFWRDSWFGPFCFCKQWPGQCEAHDGYVLPDRRP